MMTANDPKTGPADTGAADDSLKGKTAETIATTMHAVREQAAKTAAGAGEAAKDAAMARASTAKQALSDKGEETAERLHDSAERQGGNISARMLDILADGVSEASSDLRGMSLNALLSKTEAFARQNPGAFVAGAAIAGFAMARFARASQPDSGPSAAGASRAGKTGAGGPAGSARMRAMDEGPFGAGQSSVVGEGRAATDRPGQSGPAVLVGGHPRPDEVGRDIGGRREP
ncbi:hypothetical protein [Frigidibacter sp. SD6-1]|uniref:hypothetical protein n=1 Tax=Frigidibacter sp. SD6-1 TaxID=3032581 RepID=UPI0024E02F21|nr:hypothetical protein [Frigidibacter sp. SD6-1]